MKLTWIDDDNVKFFKNVIGDRYLKKKEGEIFAGVIDDAGTAVGAGVFLSQPETLSIEFLAVTDERRRQGIGSFLLDGMTDAARKLEKNIAELVGVNVNQSVYSASVMIALSTLDEMNRCNEDNDNLRLQLKDYADEASRARLERDSALREVELLKNRIAELEKKSGK